MIRPPAGAEPRWGRARKAGRWAWVHRERFDAALALAAFAALPARAELEAWNPEEVLAAAQQLEITLRDLEKSSRQLVVRL
jgi:hypothetical protein